MESAPTAIIRVHGNEVDDWIHAWQTTGDRLAREKLLQHYQPFLKSQASKYSIARKIEFDEALQAAHLGLCETLDRFDPTMNCRITTYGKHWIRKQMVRVISERRVVPIPVSHVQNGLSQLGKARAAIERDGVAATPAALAAELRWSLDRVERIASSGFTHSSLNAPLSDDGEGSMTGLDLLAADPSTRPDVEFESASGASALRAAIDEAAEAVLTERQRIIFRMRFLEEKTLEETGVALRLTRERIRQIEHRDVLPKMKEALLEYAAAREGAGLDDEDENYAYREDQRERRFMLSAGRQQLSP